MTFRGERLQPGIQTGLNTLNPYWILCNASTRDLGERGSVCVYVYIHVCRCAHMSTYDICLPIALHITFCAHHFSLTGQ